jgi:hypothetical protein
MPQYVRHLQGNHDEALMPHALAVRRPAPERHSAFAFTERPGTSRLARPGEYFDKIGRRAGLMGMESGQFEMRIWPRSPCATSSCSFSWAPPRSRSWRATSSAPSR